MDKIISTKVSKTRKITIKPNNIYNFDCLVGLKSMSDSSVDLIIADPPYNIGKDFGNDSDRRTTEEYVAWSKEWIEECFRVLKPEGTMYIYGFSEILAHLSVEIKYEKRWLIWHYTNKNVPSLNFWQRSHESIIVTWKNSKVFNRDLVREPYTDGFLNNSAGKSRTNTPSRFSKAGKETIYNAHSEGALPRDVIKIPALAGGAGYVERWFICETCNGVFPPNVSKKHKGHSMVKHPTQKPLELTRKLILASLPVGEKCTVLVPFVGSGSECAMTKELGHNYIGFELNKNYVKLAKKFISGHNSKSSKKSS